MSDPPFSHIPIKMDINCRYKLTTTNSSTDSQNGVKICIIPASVVLKEATIGAIPHSNEK